MSNEFLVTVDGVQFGPYADNYNDGLETITLNGLAGDGTANVQVTVADAADGTPLQPEVIFISELHYDNFGGDVDEQIELTALAGTDLANYEIYLYNGNGGAVYSTVSLSGIVSDEANGYGTEVFDVTGIQNADFDGTGDPDAIALVDITDPANPIVIQFISYEGTFIGYGGPADGILSEDIGAEEPGEVGESLQLTDAGWIGPAANSFDVLNANLTADSTPVIQSCSTTIDFDAPLCTVCMLTASVEIGDCDANDLFNIDVTVDEMDPASAEFTIDLLDANGNAIFNYGTFDYTADPVSIGPFIGDNITAYSISVSDTADPDCSQIVNFGPVSCEIVYNPSIEIVKDDSTPDPNDASDMDGTDTQTVDEGDDANFTITVTNTGDEDLTNVVVTDPNGADCEATYTDNDGILAVGESWTYTCTVTDVSADFVNTAFVSADGVNSGTTVNDDDATAVIVVPITCPSLFTFAVDQNVICSNTEINFTASLNPDDAENGTLTISDEDGNILTNLTDDNGDFNYTGSIIVTNNSCAPTTNNYTVTLTCTDTGDVTGFATEDVTVYPSSIEQYVSVVTDEENCMANAVIDPACDGFINATTSLNQAGLPGQLFNYSFCFSYFSDSSPGCFDSDFCIDGSFECEGCEFDAGILPTGINKTCFGSTVSIPVFGQEVGSGGVLTYILHDGIDNNIGTILGSNQTGTFTNDGDYPLNVDLFICTVAGFATPNGIPDFNDDCTDISDVCTPVRFLLPVTIESNEICNDATGEFTVTFTVTGGTPSEPGFSGTYDVTGDYTGEVFADTPTTIGPFSDGTTWSIEVDDDKGCGAVASGTVQCEKLPIELISFTGEVISDGNLLKWETATEINNDYFTLERSVDGVNFEFLTTIEGAGNSYSNLGYDYLDKDAPNGLSYYKLWQTDFDGTTSYAGIVTLQRGESSFDIVSLTPNPAVNTISIQWQSPTESDIEIEILDAIGQLVAVYNVNSIDGLNEASLNISDFASGIYFVNMRSGDKLDTIKFIKQ